MRDTHIDCLFNFWARCPEFCGTGKEPVEPISRRSQWLAEYALTGVEPGDE